MVIKNIVEYLNLSAILFPNNVAVRDSSTVFCYNQLVDAAKKIASRIINISKKDIRKPVIIFLPKKSESVVSFFGVAYSGNFYVPVDISQPLVRLQKIFDIVNPFLIISDSASNKKLSELNCKAEILLIEEISDIAYDDRLIDEIQSNVIDTDPLYMIFTSGSTGVPKGVVISHRSVIDYTEWVKDIYDIHSDDVLGSQAPFYFDMSVLDIYSSVKNGAELNIIPDNNFTFPVKLLDYLSEHKITTIFWVPSILINIANANILDTHPPKYLKRLLFAGEVMPTKQLNIWRKFFPSALYSNLYGPTEITVTCTYYIVERELKDDEPLPIGFPCSNTDIILLKEDNKLAERGEQGEIFVRGSSLALGYYNNSEKTAEAFVQNPLNPHYTELLYRTGDLAYYNGYGELIFVGRKDYQIKHMGYRLELGEIEHLASSIKEIKHACILYNKDKKEITIFYSAEKELTAGFIRTELGRSLPKYALPTKFIFMEDLPKNPNGKIDRQELNKIMIEESDER